MKDYWKALREIGILYGRDVVLAHDIVNGNFIRCLEYNGRLFKTAKDIYVAVTGEAL